MEEKTREELISIIKKSIEFKNKNLALLSVDSKLENKEVIITSDKSIEELSFKEGDVLTIGIFFLNENDRIKKFKVIKW